MQSALCAKHVLSNTRRDAGITKTGRAASSQLYIYTWNQSDRTMEIIKLSDCELQCNRWSFIRSSNTSASDNRDLYPSDKISTHLYLYMYMTCTKSSMLLLIIDTKFMQQLKKNYVSSLPLGRSKHHQVYAWMYV